MCIQSSSRTQSKLPQLSVGEPLLCFIADAFKHRSTMFFWHFHQVLLPSGLSHVIWQADFLGLTLPVPDVPVLFPTWWTGLPSAWPSLSLLTACYQLHEFFSSLGVFISENYQPVGLFPGLLGHSTPLWTETVSALKNISWWICVLLLPEIVAAPVCLVNQSIQTTPYYITIPQFMVRMCTLHI